MCDPFELPCLNQQTRHGAENSRLSQIGMAERCRGIIKVTTHSIDFARNCIKDVTTAMHIWSRRLFQMRNRKRYEPVPTARAAGRAARFRAVIFQKQSEVSRRDAKTRATK